MWRNGRRNGLKIRWAIQGPCRFESGHRQFSNRYSNCGLPEYSVIATKVLEDDHGVAEADEVFHSCGVPVCKTDATVTCRPADRLRIIRAVNADARFV